MQNTEINNAELDAYISGEDIPADKKQVVEYMHKASEHKRNGIVLYTEISKRHHVDAFYFVFDKKKIHAYHKGNTDFCEWATKEIFLPVLRMNSNSHQK